MLSGCCISASKQTVVHKGYINRKSTFGVFGGLPILQNWRCQGYWRCQGCVGGTLHVVCLACFYHCTISDLSLKQSSGPQLWPTVRRKCNIQKLQDRTGHQSDHFWKPALADLTSCSLPAKKTHWAKQT